MFDKKNVTITELQLSEVKSFPTLHKLPRALRMKGGN
jgi:hypothetical protein